MDASLKDTAASLLHTLDTTGIPPVSIIYAYTQLVVVRFILSRGLPARRMVGKVTTMSTKLEVGTDCRRNVYVTVEWLKKHLEDVAVVDVRGAVETYAVEPGVEQSTYKACRDEYLRGHIQVGLLACMRVAL